MSQVYGRTDEQFRNVKAAINPQDGIEDLYADDLAETSAFKRALNQALDEQIRSSVLDELHELLLPLFESDDKPLVKLLSEWSRGEPLASEAIALMLLKKGTTEEEIRSRAMLRSLPTIRIMDPLHTSAATRRDRDLAAILAWRQHKRQRQIFERAAGHLAGNRTDETKEGEDDERTSTGGQQAQCQKE